MDNKDVKRRDVMDFDKFSKAYEQANKLIPLKQGESAHPGAHAIQGENLYVRNDANPYKAMGIPYDEKQADINPKYMNANQVDVFHNRKLTPEEKKTVTDAYGSQVVTHHQMAFILDESIADEIKWGILSESTTRILNKDEFDKKLKESEETDNIKTQIATLEAENAEGYREDIQKLKMQLAVKSLKDKTKVSESEEADTKDEEKEKPKEEPKEEISPAEAAKAEYNGKSVTLNGDHAKLTDKDGTANIKSETNELSMSWVEAGAKMKKGGNFRTEKKEEEPKEEKPKEKETEKKKAISEAGNLGFKFLNEFFADLLKEFNLVAIDTSAILLDTTSRDKEYVIIRTVNLANETKLSDDDIDDKINKVYSAHSTTIKQKLINDGAVREFTSK